MPFLDANALKDDPDGLAFLAEVLGAADSPHSTPPASFVIEAANQAGGWTASRAGSVQSSADTPVAEMA